MLWCVSTDMEEYVCESTDMEVCDSIIVIESFIIGNN